MSRARPDRRSPIDVPERAVPRQPRLPVDGTDTDAGVAVPAPRQRTDTPNRAGVRAPVAQRPAVTDRHPEARDCAHDRDRPQAAPSVAAAAWCPTCGTTPNTRQDRIRLRVDLATMWLYPDTRHPEELVQCRHCIACQPHERLICIECSVCGDGPILAGLDPSTCTPPPTAQEWLLNHDWRVTAGGWTCGKHRPHQPPRSEHGD